VVAAVEELVLPLVVAVLDMAPALQEARQQAVVLVEGMAVMVMAATVVI
jgi:hypothetical protein